MRRFNPEKELNKIQKGNKNKIILGVIALLLVIAIGSSYALYQIKYNKRIIYTTVDKFYSKDIQISLYVDGEKDTTSETFPDKESGKIFSHITCENGSSGVFDNTKWELSLKITKQDKCNVYFITGNLPNPPELYQGMIPVTYDEAGNVYVADVDSDWYNYQDHRWGNAVLVDNTKEGVTAKYFDENNNINPEIVGKKIPMEEILQMYVWIPRYKYKIFSLGTTDTPKQIIEIAFEKDDESTGDFKCTYEISAGTVTENCPGIEIGKWYTHPAFTFGETELKGIWVGKFEPSDAKDVIGFNVNKIGEITILPNKTSVVNNTVFMAFNAEQKLTDEGNKYNLKHGEVDTHMMKNMEWGAMAYLTQSVYGIYKDENTCNIGDMNFEECEVWKNNTAQGPGTEGTYQYGGTVTGCVGTNVNDEVEWNTNNQESPAICPAGRRWNENGVKASTTGNMYGIYDTSGGTWEYVMGLMGGEDTIGLYQEADGGFITSTPSQEDSLLDYKYYDLYTYNDNRLVQEKTHFGDATKEILEKYGKGNGVWNADHLVLPEPRVSWFLRGGMYNLNSGAGIFAFGSGGYGAFHSYSFRSVLTAA